MHLLLLCLSDGLTGAPALPCTRVATARRPVSRGGARCCPVSLAHVLQGLRYALCWVAGSSSSSSDLLQEAVTRAANEWGQHRLNQNEQRAVDEALKKGKYWLARLLEREARGRYVQRRVSDQFDHLYDFSLNKGVDVVDPTTGTRYEILSGTDSNLARHGRRMAGEFFRMLTF